MTELYYLSAGVSIGILIGGAIAAFMIIRSRRS